MKFTDQTLLNGLILSFDLPFTLCQQPKHPPHTFDSSLFPTMTFKLWTKQKLSKQPQEHTDDTIISNTQQQFAIPEGLDLSATPKLRRSKRFYYLSTDQNLHYSWEHIEDINDAHSVQSKGVGIFRCPGEVVEMETRSYVSEIDSVLPSDSDEEDTGYSQYHNMTQGTYDLQATTASTATTSTTITSQREPQTETTTPTHLHQLDTEGDLNLLDDFIVNMHTPQEAEVVRLQPVQRSPQLVPVAKKRKLDYFTFERPPTPLQQHDKSNPF